MSQGYYKWRTIIKPTPMDNANLILNNHTYHITRHQALVAPPLPPPLLFPLPVPLTRPPTKKAIPTISLASFLVANNNNGFHPPEPPEDNWELNHVVYSNLMCMHLEDE